MILKNTFTAKKKNLSLTPSIYTRNGSYRYKGAMRALTLSLSLSVYIATEARRRLSARIYIYVHVTIYDDTSPRRLVLALDIYSARGHSKRCLLSPSFLARYFFFVFFLDSPAFSFDLYGAEKREAPPTIYIHKCPPLWAV